jgi:hypothetical protein
MFRDRYDTIETLKMFGLITFFLVIFAYLSNQDYREMVDTVTPVRYNCDMLIGGWHPDVPVNIINECRKINHGN